MLEKGLRGLITNFLPTVSVIYSRGCICSGQTGLLGPALSKGHSHAPRQIKHASGDKEHLLENKNSKQWKSRVKQRQ